jgi:hypothetical protein
MTTTHIIIKCALLSALAAVDRSLVVPLEPLYEHLVFNNLLSVNPAEVMNNVFKNDQNQHRQAPGFLAPRMTTDR